MTRLAKTMRAFARDERGATAIEYGLIAACITLVILSGVQAVGGSVSTFYELVAAMF